jgi:ubiquinone/menaquinone biosynthesis C-methylase UbiE
MRAWIDFYDSAHSIYVNARHRDIHFRRLASDLAGYVRPGAVVLDYGCGEALHADVVAAEAERLILVEPASGVRARLAARWTKEPKIEVGGADRIGHIDDHSIDLIIMHSVAQYLTGPELDAVLAQFRRLLKPDGMLVLGDVIHPKTSAASDAAALLRFGARDGFFFAAVAGLARTVLSPYSRLRSSLGLTRYDEKAMIEKLEASGFTARRAGENIGHSRARMTFLALPAGSAALN